MMNSTANRIVKIDEELCVGCGTCVSMCPQQILYIDEATGKCRVREEARCDRRRGCEAVCSTDAIKVSGR